MKTWIIAVLAMVMVGLFLIGMAAAQGPAPTPPVATVQPPPPAVPTPPVATVQQLQKAIQDLTDQIRVQVGIRDKAVVDLHQAMSNIDRQIAQLQQLQAELKKREAKPAPKPESKPPAKEEGKK